MSNVDEICAALLLDVCQKDHWPVYAETADILMDRFLLSELIEIENQNVVRIHFNNCIDILEEIGAANIFGRHNKNYKISLNSKRFFDRMSKDWRGVRIFNFGKSRDSFKKYVLLNKYYDGELPFDSPLDLSKYLNS